VTNWEPPADLTRLLEALAGEIIDSTDAEMQVANAPTLAGARAAVALVLQMRDLIGAALDEPAELNKGLPLLDRDAVGELRHRPN
jgi:hypothetical protein